MTDSLVVRERQASESEIAEIYKKGIGIMNHNMVHRLHPNGYNQIASNVLIADVGDSEKVIRYLENNLKKLDQDHGVSVQRLRQLCDLAPRQKTKTMAGLERGLSTYASMMRSTNRDLLERAEYADLKDRFERHVAYEIPALQAAINDTKDAMQSLDTFWKNEMRI